MLPRDPPHYLKALKTTRVPKRLAYLDCVTIADTKHGETVERWKAGALGLTHWTAKRNEQIDTLDVYTDASELWSALDRFCTHGRRVTVFTYDLAYQLRISKALVVLPAQGWTLEKIVLERGASWALLRESERSVIFVDLLSWTQSTFAKIAASVDGGEHVKAVDPTKRKWSSAVAANRVQVIRTFALRTLEWIEQNDLGSFKPTGSGQSYSAFRRRFMNDRILVHDDIGRLEIERVSMWAGRCEAWKHGKQSGGPFTEIDMRAAYCRIAAECPVPTHAKSVISKPSVMRVTRLMERYAVLAQVEVETDVPIAPTRFGERTVWPVGKFTTWLWSPELALAFEYGRKVTIRKAYTYTVAPVLQDFALWVLGHLDTDNSLRADHARLILKHWSRSLVGRLGLRYRSWERFGEQSPPDLRLVTYLDHVDGVKTDMLLVGNDRLVLTEMREGSESVPQIPAWVMSECRRRLWETMMMIGLDNVMYVDTDSIITNAAGIANYDNIVAKKYPGRWAEKSHYKRLTINGPRNLALDDDRRVSGLPLDARQTAPLEYTGEVMKSIRESMRAGQLDCVTSVPRTFTFDLMDLRREHLPDGKTQPYRLES